MFTQGVCSGDLEEKKGPFTYTRFYKHPLNHPFPQFMLTHHWVVEFEKLIYVVTCYRSLLARDSLQTTSSHVKVEGLHQLIGGDASVKAESEEDKDGLIASPSGRRR